MTNIPDQPIQPSNEQIAAELGIAPGTHGRKKEIQRRRCTAPSQIAYEAALAAWHRHPTVIAQAQARRADQAAAAQQAAEADKARQAQLAQVLTRWQALPVRGRVAADAWQTRSRHMRMRALANHLRKFVTVDQSDRSETLYITLHGNCRLRISCHELGRADYGAREQVHAGPEVIVQATDTPEHVLGYAINEAREYRPATPGDRHRAGATLRALRSAHNAL